MAQIHREIKLSVTRRQSAGVIREICQYLRFISAHALERTSLAQSIKSTPAVLHNVTVNKPEALILISAGICGDSHVPSVSTFSEESQEKKSAVAVNAPCYETVYMPAGGKVFTHK